MTPPPAWSNDHKKLIKATIDRENQLSSADLQLLQHLSLSKGLDPLASEIYMVKKGAKATPIVSVNGMTKLCAAAMDGFESSWFDDDGNAHPVWLKQNKPSACQVKIFRKGSARPFVYVARMADYDTGRAMWKSMPARMIEKVATCGCLRLGFADLVSGLYCAEEMSNFNYPDPVPIRTETAPEAPQTSPKASSNGMTAPPSPDTAEVARASDSAASRASDDVAIEIAAENLAKSMNGIVVQTQREPLPNPRSADDLRAIGRDRGLTEPALSQIIKLIEGDIEKGIRGIQNKTQDEIQSLNERYAVKKAVRSW